MNPPAVAAIRQTTIIGKASGKSTFEAEQLSALAMKGKITVQATITAMKDITGNTVILILVAAGIAYLLPYHKKETT